MSEFEESNLLSSDSNTTNSQAGNKPSSPVDKPSGTFTNDSTDSVDSASGLRHRIFAGNLDFGTTKEQLYEAFSKCGKIVDEIRLHPGYAFIQFDSEQACSKAIATLSGTQLCSKRIDVQMAKGPNNSQKKDTKRKLDSRDRPTTTTSRSGDSKNDRFSRDRDNKNKKQKRTPQPSNSLPSSMPSSATTIPNSSPYSSGASGVTSVPIYIPDQTLEPFANFVMQTLKSGGLIYHNVHIRNTNQGELFFTSPQFLQLVANERFVIYILARHELSRSVVSFKALMPDGTSPGFADTMITDICSFILNSPPLPVQVPNPYQQYAMQYSAGVPPSNVGLSVPGLSFGYNNTPQQQQSSPQRYNRPPTSNQGSSNNYGNNASRDNRSSYNNRNNNNNRRNDRRDDDRRGNNNRSNSNYRGGNNNNNHQKDSGSSNDNNEVQGLIIKLLDTINKKPNSSNNSSILLSESANSTTGHDDYHSPSNQYQ